VSARVRRRRTFAVVIVVSLAVVAWLVTPSLWDSVTSSGDDDLRAVGVGAVVRPTPSAAAPSASPTPSETPVATTTTTASTTTTTSALPAGLTAADVAAGLLAQEVPKHGTGHVHVVRGSSKAPGKGRIYNIRVEVEGGLDVDRQKFAAFVMKTLNDPRGWGHGGTKTFARTDGNADITVVLASPDLSAQLCRPLVTNGTLSCRNGARSILTVYRWAKATPDFGKDRTGYRRYVVNHEVGHALGHGHEYCAGKGRLAPVMMQQTKGVGACRPNPWPFP
jgi:hypothetical protein